MPRFRILAIAAASLVAISPAMAQKATHGADKSAPTTSTAKSGSMVDINSASKDQLEELKGVSGTRANAIIKGRPYKDMHELVEKKILPQNVYDGIKGKIVAKAATAPAAATGTKSTATPPAKADNKTTESSKSGRKTTSAMPADEYKTEADAKKHCPGDTVVWANPESKIYHFSNASDYGKTKQGAYMCEKESDSAGFRAARNEKAPTKN